MQVPEYWAEARIEGRVQGKRRVVRRFGWSDTSQDAAQQQAEQRAQAALGELQAGRRVAPREQKVPYGIAGLPIREQVLVRHGDLVVTRNAYGARCLNEPDVLFADLDLEPRLAAWRERLFDWLAALLALTVVALGILQFTQQHAGRGCFLLLIGPVAALYVLRWRVRLRHGPTNLARCRERLQERVRDHARRHREVRFAVYETPAGLRVLALHRTYDPTSPEVRELFEVLAVDRAYAQMCALQACFRARLSAKPWRIGIARHIVPRPGVWPVREERRAEREAWIERYEAVAVGYAACRWVEDLGDGRVDLRCAQVQRVHDELSRARSGLPLA